MSEREPDEATMQLARSHFIMWLGGGMAMWLMQALADGRADWVRLLISAGVAMLGMVPAAFFAVERRRP